MFNAPKLNQSVSTSGPSTTVQPMAPKIAAISSMVREIGWIRPLSLGRGGRVGSIRSDSRRASSAASSSAIFRLSIADVSASFRRFNAAPRSFRCSGGVLPRSRSMPVRVPLTPEYGDADCIPGAQIGRGGQRGISGDLQGFEIVVHR